MQPTPAAETVARDARAVKSRGRMLWPSYPTDPAIALKAPPPRDHRAFVREVIARLARPGTPLQLQHSQTYAPILHPAEVAAAIDKALLLITRRDVVPIDADKLTTEQVQALHDALRELTGYRVMTMWSGGARAYLGDGVWYALPAPWAIGIARDLGHEVVLGYHLLAYARDSATRARIIEIARNHGADARPDSAIRVPGARYRTHFIDLDAEPRHELERGVQAAARRLAGKHAGGRRWWRTAEWKREHAKWWDERNNVRLLSWVRGLPSAPLWSPEPTADWAPGSVRRPATGDWPANDPRWRAVGQWHEARGEHQAVRDLAAVWDAQRRSASAGHGAKFRFNTAIKTPTGKEVVRAARKEAAWQLLAHLEAGNGWGAGGIADEVGLRPGDLVELTGVPSERVWRLIDGCSASIEAPVPVSMQPQSEPERRRTGRLEELLQLNVSPGQRSEHNLRICNLAQAEGYAIEYIESRIPTAPGLDGYRRRHDAKRGTTVVATPSWGRKRLRRDWATASRAFVSRRARTIESAIAMGLPEPVLAVYLALVRCEGGRCGKAGSIRISHGELAIETGYSQAAVNKAVHELVRLRLVRYLGPRAKFGSRHAQEYALVEQARDEELQQSEHRQTSPPSAMDVRTLMRGVALLRHAGVPLSWQVPAETGRRTMLSMLLDGRAGPEVLAGMGDVARRGAKRWTAAARAALAERRERYYEILDRMARTGLSAPLRELERRAAGRDEEVVVIGRRAA